MRLQVSIRASTTKELSHIFGTAGNIEIAKPTTLSTRFVEFTIQIAANAVARLPVQISAADNCTFHISEVTITNVEAN